ncbi:MAG: hypothetical protein JXB49_17775 [Bacteroidales bacterium]|nr:hypothetical protein [Bacteroidales bacterium]MBN2818352.1 hypothetical protein [Bacteroidales bacterium]
MQIGQEIIDKGKRKTLIAIFALISFSILISVFTQLNLAAISQKKLSQDFIRVLIEAGLYYAIYIGKNRARITMFILFGITILASVLYLISSFILNSQGTYIMLFLVVIYGVAIYFFKLDTYFRSFFEYQRKTR